MARPMHTPMVWGHPLLGPRQNTGAQAPRAMGMLGFLGTGLARYSQLDTFSTYSTQISARAVVQSPLTGKSADPTSQNVTTPRWKP